MARGVCWFLVSSLVLAALTGCGRWFAEREPWRREAEVACLKSGAVKESPAISQISPINGPGICGADFPLRVSALGEAPALSFADSMRPPADIPGLLARMPPTLREPIPVRPLPEAAPSVDENEPQADDRPRYRTGPAPRMGYPASRMPAAPPTPAIGPTAFSPPATLACPMVSAIDTWLATSVQPLAMRWFGQPVAEIKQISAYSCRGMNGQPGARISEHAFGNALDIAAFTLADGRKITVRDGWRGPPEEQGFLRDVQASACAVFSTVLAPGSNIYHYDHLHIDLMRRASGRAVCNPDAVSGEEVAARAMRRTPFAGRRGEPTGSVGRNRGGPHARAGED